MTPVTHSWVERIKLQDYSEHPYHTSRYEFGARYVAGKTVLDIACGAGYGTNFLLSKGAKSVVGMDTDFQTIASSIQETSLSSYRQISLVNASATSIPVPDKSFDVIISFETIEHIADYSKCLKEFARVLADDGLLILSTPNALVTQPVNGIPRNPFHIKEFTPQELSNVLGQFFCSVNLLGQHIRGTVGSGDTLASHTRAIRPFVELFPLSWRVALPNLLPRRVADALVFAVTSHNAVITNKDMEFNAVNIDESPVVVALCQKSIAE